MSSILKRLAAGIRRAGKPARSRRPVIVCGLNYHAYRLLAELAGSREYRVLALVDDEPWNHATDMQGVRVYYPSEVVSLVKRHGVVAVVHGDARDIACFDAATRAELAERGVPFVAIDAAEEAEQRLASALSR
ncbi:nucleoside-diphosphate sugar epimerase/dehydratase [Modicisalibacter radicis]|uniref:nucleoside-diphosphate sugar epimerase/dehydratase n=1 Tax=Halomonas sp. EAR18 TaxID=2518972 RepID=UPI00109D4BB1|nr:hypothetical protein [Halomonas sp. EAR18]